MAYTGLSGEKWTFWPVIKTGLVQKIKIQSCSPVTTTHHHVSGHCHVVNCLLLPPLPPTIASSPCSSSSLLPAPRFVCPTLEYLMQK